MNIPAGSKDCAPDTAHSVTKDNEMSYAYITNGSL